MVIETSKSPRNASSRPSRDTNAGDPFWTGSVCEDINNSPSSAFVPKSLHDAVSLKLRRVPAVPWRRQRRFGIVSNNDGAVNSFAPPAGRSPFIAVDLPEDQNKLHQERGDGASGRFSGFELDAFGRDKQDWSRHGDRKST